MGAQRVDVGCFAETTAGYAAPHDAVSQLVRSTGRDVPKLMLEHSLRISDLEEALSGTTDEEGDVVECKALKMVKRQHLLHAHGLLHLDELSKKYNAMLDCATCPRPGVVLEDEDD